MTGGENGEGWSGGISGEWKIGWSLAKRPVRLLIVEVETTAGRETMTIDEEKVL